MKEEKSKTLIETKEEENKIIEGNHE